MADKFWYVVMVPMVYASIAWCLFWIVVRVAEVLKTPSLPHTLRIFPEGRSLHEPPSAPMAGAFWDAFTMPTVRKINPLFWAFLIAFHIALFLLILAHLDILPQVKIMAKDSEHMLGNGVVGVVITVSLLYFLFRRFRTPVREVTVPGDYLILFLLLCVAMSGDIISWGNSWTDSGFVMTKKDFAGYLDSLVRFTFADPRQFLSGSHYSVIGSHVLLANLFLLYLPFSKIMHAFFAVPLNKLRRG